MKVSAIILAAGSGARLSSPVPKAFVKLGPHPMLYYSLRTVAAIAGIGEAVVTIPPGMESAARAQAAQAGVEIPVKITEGGFERQDSVRIALSLTSAESQWVIVHDAARPLATPALFEACLAAAQTSGAAIAAIPLTDTVKRVQGDTIAATVAREGLYQAQTPQAFSRSLLIRAHQRAMGETIAATDDADLVERIGAPVRIVLGSTLNLKVTTPADLEAAQALIHARS